MHVLFLSPIYTYVSHASDIGVGNVHCATETTFKTQEIEICQAYFPSKNICRSSNQKFEHTEKMQKNGVNLIFKESTHKRNFKKKKRQ